MANPTGDLVGLQVLARAVGTTESLDVDVALYSDGQRVSASVLRVFPNLALQRASIRFDGAVPNPRIEAVLTMQPAVQGGVIFGATREDRYASGRLALDDTTPFADQDLALRTVHRRTAWQALGLLANGGPAAYLVAGITLVAIALLAGLAGSALIDRRRSHEA